MISTGRDGNLFCAFVRRGSAPTARAAAVTIRSWRRVASGAKCDAGFELFERRIDVS
jgi:hypothetical protein